MWHLNKIPKILHVYYGGGSIPYARYMTIKSFLNLNPDWQIKFYYPKFHTVEKSWVSFEQKYHFSGKDYLPEIMKLPIKKIEIDFKNLGLKNNISEVYKSDFLRLYLLSTEGGLWSDMDIIYFRGMNDLYFNTEEYKNLNNVVCISEYGHSIGFMLADENNKYYKFLLDKAKKEWNPDNYQSIGSILANKYFPSIDSIAQRLPGVKAINLPMDIVYTYDATKIKEIFRNKGNEKFLFSNRSIGLHWYAGHNLAGDFLNKTEGGLLATKDSIIGTTLLTSSSLTMAQYVINNTKAGDTILDLGCGDKSISNSILSCSTPRKVVTVDIWPKFNPDILWDLTKFPLPFADNTYDVILLLDTIEHVDRNFGVELLKEVKRITKNKIILVTPLWWDTNTDIIKNEKSPYFQNPYEEHKTLWHKSDFSDWKEIKEVTFLGNYFIGQWEKND